MNNKYNIVEIDKKLMCQRKKNIQHTLIIVHNNLSLYENN